MKTKEKLAQVLNAAGLFDLERRARAGEFDDIETSHATPIINLVIELEQAGFPELAERARQGEWDCTREEWQAWINRKAN